MVEPIKPKDVVKAKGAALPDEVIEAFNELIAKYTDGKVSIVKQKEVVNVILFKLKLRDDRDRWTAQGIFDNHWLDVEKVYQKAGWKVEYDKPGYNESYEATFKFTAPTMRG
jgi:hypothetical protein